jgi:NAD(P) transhydrogenase subunit alpha
MRIGVPAETVPGERRVALVPDGVRRLTRADVSVAVESGAGVAAGFADSMYEEAGAEIAPNAAAALQGADLVCKVQQPQPSEIPAIPEGSTVVCLLPPGVPPDVSALAARGITVLALERVPRITRAQSMDVLSSQATIAGYKAVLLGASSMVKLLPMLTTAAGSIPPARAFVIGAGVAGLQAIATARRLGAVVSAFDVRPAAAEQVKSLGASFVGGEVLDREAEAAGGYARAQSEDEQARTLDIIAAHIRDQDLVITTAQVPGRAAPRLITAAMVESMHAGSVIVDLASETGGNCELTRRGETVVVNGVSVVGPVNLPSTVPLHASMMFSRNMETLIRHLLHEGELRVDADDEITGAMIVGRGAA